MEWVACAGIDWGEKEHAYTVRSRDGSRGCGRMGSSAEEVHEWARGLRERFPAGTIVVGLEHGRWSLVYGLMGYEFLTIVPINPRASKAYRESLRLSGSSNDPLDAELICEFVMKHLSELRLWQPDDSLTRKLRILVETRRTLVDQRTAFTHALASTLKEYFPQVLQWFGGETSATLRAIIGRWPTLEQLREVSEQELTALLRSQRVRKAPARAQQMIEKIRSAVALTCDEAIIEGQSMYAQTLIALIDPLEVQIRKYDAAIAAAWAEHPDRKIFDGLPGAGAVFAPRLAVAFGTDRSRWGAADDLQCYSGIAPVTEQSGRQRWVHARWGCPTFLRQTFHEFAASSIPHCRWAKAYYDERREGGAGHHQTVRALAFRWMRILYRLWKDRLIYDEATYIEALKRRHSPLALRLAA